jgi:hypothetical protein
MKAKQMFLEETKFKKIMWKMMQQMGLTMPKWHTFYAIIC